MPFNQGIFPTSVYGQLSDSYGLPSYTATTGFPGPNGSGLVLGQGWLLFDFTVVNLLKAAASIAANAACNPVAGTGNFYTVQSAVIAGGANNGTAPITAINDRGGALSTVGAINWMTMQGLASALCAGSLTASSNTNGAPLGASAVTGQLTSLTAGSYLYNNVILLSNTTTAGAYPVLIGNSQ